jgi:hypothetical protein
LNDGEDFLQQNNNNNWIAVGITTWFSKQKFKQYTSPLRENIVTWDLWGDTRQGNYSDIDDPAVGEASSRYAINHTIHVLVTGEYHPAIFPAVEILECLCLMKTNTALGVNIPEMATIQTQNSSQTL